MAESFLLRRHVFKSRKLNTAKLGLGGETAMSGKLDKVGKRGVDWEFDDGKVNCYKGLRHTAIRSSKTKDAEEQSADSILLSSGDPDDKAVAAETESRLLAEIDLADEFASRVYFDAARESEYAKVLAGYSIREER